MPKEKKKTQKRAKTAPKKKNQKQMDDISE